jgi:hypothetical protein
VTGHGNGWPLASTIRAAGPYSHGQNLRFAKTALVSAEALQINSLIRLPLYNQISRPVLKWQAAVSRLPGRAFLVRAA